MRNHLQIRVGNSVDTAKGFIDAWKRAEQGEEFEAEHRLVFENLESLLKTLTPARWILLRSLRAAGPRSIRGLARELERDYKNVHTDVKALEIVGLIGRNANGEVEVPWDIVEARLRLAA